MSSGRKRSRPHTEEEEEEEQHYQGERWTHFGGSGGEGGGGHDDDDEEDGSSVGSFAATFEYPLSRYLEPSLCDHKDWDEMRLVMYRVNSSCVVAPFLEFALMADGGDWPSVDAAEVQEAAEAEDGGGEHEGGEEEEDRCAAATAAATNAAYVLAGVAPENGHNHPRFCGASFATNDDDEEEQQRRRQYAWFQVDPSVTASAELVWVTVHELVRVHAIRGAPLAAETASFDPRVWVLLDGRGQPMETPMVLEPLAFLNCSSGDGSSSAMTETQTEANWVDRMLQCEADPGNYSPRDDPVPSDHRLVGKTMYSFHDPHWPTFLATATAQGGGGEGAAASESSGSSSDEEVAKKGRRHAVFLEDTLYLVGDCSRENAALLEFADQHSLFGSVYLRCADTEASTTAFIWLIQSSDQFAPLE